MASRPKYTLKLSRKDKKSIKFTDHKGKPAENRFQPIGALFENQFGGFNMAIDKNGPLGKYADEFYVTLYSNDEAGGGRDDREQSGGGEDDDDNDIPF